MLLDTNNSYKPRRLPIFIVVDISGKEQAQIDRISDKINKLLDKLRRDPFLLETSHIEIIVYNGCCRVDQPLSEIYEFPEVKITTEPRGECNQDIFNFIIERFDSTLIKTTLEKKGDWRPKIVFFGEGFDKSYDVKDILWKWLLPSNFHYVCFDPSEYHYLIWYSNDTKECEHDGVKYTIPPVPYEGRGEESIYDIDDINLIEELTKSLQRI